MDEREKQAFDLCNSKIAEHDLAMELKDVKHEDDKIIFSFVFTANEILDLRDLAKDLAVIFNMRVELRQVRV